MGKRFLWAPCALFVLSLIIISWKPAKTTPASLKYKANSGEPSLQLFSNYINAIYQTAKLQEAGLDNSVFEKAITGFYNLKASNKLNSDCAVITIVDLSKSSCSKRMWIVDLKKMQLLLNTWVAHGEGSGEDVPDLFSNEESSYQSSLGFYITGNTYQGKHGLSLKLNGMDEGFNDMAAHREIVVHAAPYVSQRSINLLGRLGRSQGCPAVSPKVINKVIGMIKDRTVLFINGNDYTYTSKYLDRDLAANTALGDQPGDQVSASL